MNDAQAREFARHWLHAWNSHDLEAVLSHYDPSFEMHSPVIAAMGIDPSGVLRGLEAVRAYWQAALDRLPDLRFDPIAVLTGTQSLVIHYRTNFGKLAAEVFFFGPEGKVVCAAAHYADS